MRRRRRPTNGPFLSKSSLGRIAGNVGITLGMRPSVLLGRDVSWFDSLMLDSEILAEVQPGTSESLRDDIMRKYRRYGLSV